MPESPRSRLIALNEQAIAILRLGIPLEFGFGPESIERLQQINAQLQSDGAADPSIESLLHRHAFPTRYESVARMLLTAKDPTPLFDSFALQEHARDVAANPLQQASAEPLVVAALAYVGMIVLCVATVPHLQSQYDQQGVTPGGITRLLITLKDTMPFWVIGFPIVMLALWILWRKVARETLLFSSPVGPSHAQWLAAQSQSIRLASLVAGGVDADTALELAAVNESAVFPIRPIAETIVRHSDSPSRPKTLTRLAQFYRFLASDHRQSMLFKAPALIGLMIASLVVFGFALATFLPWIEILTHLGDLRSER